MGGFWQQSYKSDILMLQTEKDELRKVRDAPFAFQAIDRNNQTQLERPDVVLSYVKREDQKTVLFRYDAKNFEIIGEDLRGK